MQSELFKPKDVERMIQLSPNTLRDWRSKRFDHGAEGGSGRYGYTAHDILRLFMMQRLTAVRIDLLRAYRASIWCAGQVCDFLEVKRDQLSEIPASTPIGKGQYSIFTFAPGNPRFSDNLNIIADEISGAESDGAYVFDMKLIAEAVPAELVFHLRNAAKAGG